MASFSAGTTFTDGVANDVTAAKLGALVNNATPTSGFIQDRTAETVTATNDTLLIGDASDSNALKRITVANFAQTLPTAKVTTGTIETGTFGTTTSTAATITTGTIPTLVATTLVTTGTGTAADPAIVPIGDTNTGLFFPAADTLAASTQGTERLRVDSSGNVGIGTASPATKLEVNGSVRIGSGNDYQFDSTLKINGESTGATGYLRFYTNSAERLRIDSSGNVGIGNTDPSAAKLVVQGAATDTETIRVITGSASGTQQKTGIGFAFSSTATNPSALISAEEFDTSDVRANIVFATNNTNTDVTPSERMRITSAGEVYIAGTTDQGAYNLQVNGTGVWGAGAYVNGSDSRIKEDIQPLASGLDVVGKLNPVTYKYKETWSSDQSIQSGFIAQELLTALDGQIYVNGVVQQGGAEGYYSVAYQNLIAVLTKAIQELKAENDSLKTRVSALEAA
jgi:hypothetical protein